MARDVAGFEARLGELGIALVGDGPIPAGAFLLTVRDGALELRPPEEWDRRGIQARFPPDREAGPGGCRRPTRAEPLVRAFGSRVVRVVDATAGLGADAYRLARSGLEVVGVERHPVVQALLESGYARDRRAGRVPESVAGRLRFEQAEARDVIAAIHEPDVGVYLDPMYPPPRRSSALPRRALQVLRRLLGGAGEEAEAVALVALARAHAARVVVKRPHHAPPIAPGATHALESKLVRFDVYQNPARASRRSAGAGTGADR